MKLNNNILSTVAPALLLCAAAFGMAGCTQGEDVLQGAGATAQGGEPIHVSVAPKPGFAGGTDTVGGSSTDTRSTVGDDGTFGWTEDKDIICVQYKFDDAASTEVEHTWQRIGAAETHSYMTGWKVCINWNNVGAELTTDFVWPLGASKVTVRAFYTDCKLTMASISGGKFITQAFDYTQGTGDHMTFMKDFSLGEDITVDFGHATTRLVFNGLKPATAYSLKAGGTALTFPTVLTVESFSLGTPQEQTFTSDADGKLVICAALDGKLNATTHKVSLEVMEGNASGTSVGTVELTARGSDADGWKMDGYMYTVNFANGSGAVNPDSKPDLLKPAPIAAGNKVYAVNGYWVTAPDADESKEYVWSSSSATVMDKDPCAGNGDWRMPTMKDFEKMAGWTTINPWSETPNTESIFIASDRDAWDAAFPYGEYWSSVLTNDSDVWILMLESDGKACYWPSVSYYSLHIRCVQPQ